MFPRPESLTHSSNVRLSFILLQDFNSQSFNSPDHNSVTTRVRVLKYYPLLTVLFTLPLVVQAPSKYDAHQTFDPSFLSQPGTAYRSGSGAPGPRYWQHRADYKIAATLDTAANVLSAHEVITYTNRSPDVLPYVWLQLDQNIMKKDSRGALAQPARGRS
jgi:hypothetical protein